MKKKLLLAFSLMGAAMFSQAQTKIGGTAGAANANAYLQLGDATGANKGLLLPRVALTSTTSASPLSAHVTGMYVYNTNTSGTGNAQVTPGLYYNDGTQWVRLQQGGTQTSILGSNAPTATTYPAATIYTDTLTGSATLGQQWTYDGTKWVSYVSSTATEWYLAGTANDAGSNKGAFVARTGALGIIPDSKFITTPGEFSNEYLLNVGYPQSYLDTAKNLDRTYSYFNGLRVNGADNQNTIWQSVKNKNLQITTNSPSNDPNVSVRVGNYSGATSTIGLTVTAAGRVGIGGITSPTTALDVNPGLLRLRTTATTEGGEIDIDAAPGTPTQSWVIDEFPASGVSQLRILPSNNTGFGIRVLGNGNVGINTTPSATLDVNGDIRSATGAFFSGTRDNYRLVLQGDRNMVLYDGGAVWTSGTGVSDIRTKTDIKTAPSMLDRVNKLQIIDFKYKKELDDNDKQRVGVIAQDVIKLFPEYQADLIYHDEKADRFLVHYDKLSVLLIKAVQEQQAQIDELKKAVAELKAGK